MPSYYRRYKRGYSGRRFYRRYYRGKYRSYYKRKYRFANGSSRSSCRIRVPVSKVIQIAFALNANQSTTQAINSWISNTSAPGGGISYSPVSAVDSELFQRYCSLYDEVKCEGMKIRFNCITPIGAGAADAIQIVTAVDRKNTVNELHAVWPVPTNLLTWGSCIKYTAINNSVPKIKRSVYASDLNEKTTYIDSDYVTLAAQQFNGAGSNPAVANSAFNAAGAGLTAFSPTIWIGATRTATAAVTYQFQVEGYMYYTFRNPKFGAAGAAKSSEPDAKRVHFDPDIPDTEIIHREDTLIDMDT